MIVIEMIPQKQTHASRNQCKWFLKKQRTNRNVWLVPSNSKKDPKFQMQRPQDQNHLPANKSSENMIRLSNGVVIFIVIKKHSFLTLLSQQYTYFHEVLKKCILLTASTSTDNRPSRFEIFGAIILQKGPAWSIQTKHPDCDQMNIELLVNIV